MSLSQENISKLCMTGLYKCEPVPEWLPSYKQNNPYWCRNWTFRVHEYNGQYYMSDTYWLSDEHPVKLTDENFDKFKLVFDFEDVERFNGTYNKWLTYPSNKRWSVPIDSGGMAFPKYFIFKGAIPVKEKIITRLKEEIGFFEEELKYKKADLRRVENDEVDLRFIQL